MVENTLMVQGGRSSPSCPGLQFLVGTVCCNILRYITRALPQTLRLVKPLLDTDILSIAEFPRERDDIPGPSRKSKRKTQELTNKKILDSVREQSITEAILHQGW